MKILFSAICFLFICRADAQTENKKREDPTSYFNSFQRFTNGDLNVDSALYSVRKLASSSAYDPLLKMLLHDMFALHFRRHTTEENDTGKQKAATRSLLFSKELLLKIASDSNQVLQQSARPLYLFSKAQDVHADPVALTSITNDFIQRELLQSDIYNNRQARYGLLIHQILSKHDNLSPLAQKLLHTIKTNLQKGQVTLTDTSSRAELNKRAWYRYLYAYSNHTEANKCEDNSKKEVFLKTAFDYSPDLIDRNHKAAYFYDMILLFGGEKESFRDEYLTFVENTSANKDQVLSTLLAIALVAPEYKNKLEIYYNNASLSSKPFREYWRAAINKNAKTAASISLTLLDNKPFASKELRGKWVLVDFWGTWCVPCRKEHPDLEKFYQSTVLLRNDSISLLTVACKDTRDRVSEYMEEKKYTFPVAMADNNIEKSYGVQGYPTKVLITPEGKYIVIPFGVDWVSFVRQYTDL